MPKNNKDLRLPPDISPYLLSIGLLILGLWCLRDGWFLPKQDMQGYSLLLNRAGSLIFLPWALFDFIRTLKIARAVPLTIPSNGDDRRDDPQR